MLGKTCSPEDTSTSSCTGVKAFQCATNECMGTSAVDCSATGVDRGIDCAAFGGGACRSFDGGTEDGGLSCAPGDKATLSCPTSGVPECAGATVYTCIAGKEVRVECARLGLPCDVSEPVGSYDPTAACINRAPSACVAPDKCIGTNLQSCGRGLLEEIDCATVGLGTCSVGPAGRAACKKP